MMDDLPVTQMLESWTRGDPSSSDELLDAIYDELHRLAERALHGERSGHTLQPTALVHETYLRLSHQQGTHWQNRGHFFAITAKMMRRVLVDYSRQRQRKKRGGDFAFVPLDDEIEPALDNPSGLLELDLALTALARFDPLKVSIVELHFFSGFSVAATAEALGISTATVSRQWRAAKAWLYQYLHSEDTHRANKRTHGD